MTNLEEKSMATGLRTRGCPVCNHVVKMACDFFAHWQYALSSDEDSQEHFATELGFCPRHAWQLHSMSSAWGESVTLTTSTERMSQMLAKTACDETASLNVERIARTRDNCRVCGVL